MLDAFVARMAGGPQKQPKKLSFGVASGGDGVKRPLSYQIAQQIMGQRQSGGGQTRPQTVNRRAKPPSGGDAIMQDALRGVFKAVAKKK
jgi:hypothetical protein